ncbi:hypothetical protein ACQCX5_07125 [Propionibacteriaceae bacterium G57]|uniref:hypothetical protein n=1 Tax=Aestuariimicrobium sp. G57 TaxID=3418485 RepID=UPI003DA73399
MRSLPGRMAILVICLVVLVGTLFAGGWVLRRLLSTEEPVIEPPPAAQGCIATSNGQSASLTPEQSKWASIIVAESIRRNLPARAATIALATAMQESSLRNIDYGDRDSVGLFQQRPSQDWGTVDQIMDPWYSSGKFYDALVKVDGWQTGDINDVAQKVQRSGVPDGYRKHVENAKVWASALTGHSPTGWTCVSREQTAESRETLTQVLTKGLAGKVTVAQNAGSWTITAKDATTAWAAASLSMANLRDAKVVGVQVGSSAWAHDPKKVAAWTTTTPGAAGATAVVLSF